MADFDNQGRVPSRAENLRLTRMPPLPPRAAVSPPAPVAPPPSPDPAPEPPPPRKRRSWWLAGLVVLLLAAGAGVAYRWRSDAVASPAASPEAPTPEATSEETATASPAPATSRAPTVAAAPSRSPRPTASPSMTGKANPDGANLALRGLCTASGVEGPPWLPKYACDGDPASRWSSAFTDSQWLRADLRQRWKLTSVTLVWERSYAAGYRVETSLDGKKWQRLYTTSAGQGGTEEIPAKGTIARYVRMVGVKRVSDYGYSLLELEVR